MVSDSERARLLKAFDDSFHYVQLMRVWVDDETGEVNVKAHSITLKVKKRIPIKMGMILGRFSCHECELETLENAPHTVTDTFSCYNNHLTSLQGGPSAVGAHSMGGGLYSCSGNFLKNFEGAPQDYFKGYFVAVNQLGTGLHSVSGLPPDARLVDITYQKDLPMLKLLNQKQVNIRSVVTGELMTDITDIINKYASQGRKGSLACAAELARAGYKGNARW